jgi:hypothetical protein
MNYLTDEQVVQLAPDASSLKAGRDLSQERKWLNFNPMKGSCGESFKGVAKIPIKLKLT